MMFKRITDQLAKLNLKRVQEKKEIILITF